MIDKYHQALKLSKKKNPDYKKGYELLIEASNAGDARANYALGTWYLHGRYVNRNLRTAIAYLKRAARESIKEALYDLAICYEMGKGVRKSHQSAFRCYLKAALLGDAQSIYEIGRCFFWGIGIEKNRQVAAVLLELAKEKGVNS